MSTQLYIVLPSHGQWWIDLEGRSFGPYTTLDIAMSGAISMAESDARAGKRAEVRVSGPGHDNRIVYQSVAQSALGRAAALAALETH